MPWARSSEYSSLRAVATSVGLGEGEAVSDPRLGDEVHRSGWHRLELLSQLGDHYAQIIHLIAVVWPPDCLQQLAVGQHRIRMRDQVAQQLELLRAEPQAAPVGRAHLSRVEVDLRLAQYERALSQAVPGWRSPQGGADPRRQLGRPERLRHVVVRA